MLGKEHLEVYADRGYYSGPEILVCEESGMVPLVPKCLVPCDHIPRRSWPLFRAKAMLDELIADLAPRSSSHRKIVPESSRA